MFANLSLVQKGLILLAMPLLLPLLFTAFLIVIQRRVHEAETLALQIEWTLWLGTITGLLATAAVAGIFHRLIRKQLLVLAENARRLEHGEPLAPPLQGSDEIAAVDRAFRVAADALKKADQAMRRSLEEVRDLYNNAPCGYHSLGPDGTFVAINDTELRWLGCRREDVIGKKKFSDFLAPKALEQFHTALARLKNEDAVNNLEYELIDTSGAPIPVLVNATALRDEAGNFVASRTTVFNIAERKRADDALRRSEQRFRLLVERVADYAIIVLNPKGRVVSWNAGAERIIGYRARDIVGQHFARFYPPDAVALQKPEDEIATAAETGRFEDEGWRVRKDGTRFWANVVLTALYRDDGELEGFCKIMRDLTEQKRTEEAIATLNTELEQRVIDRTAELAEANRDLHHKNQDIEMFVYSVSHDLRSPLVNLEGFSKELGMIALDLRGLLADPAVPEAVRKRGQDLVDRDMGEALRFIQSGVRRLSNIIDALLRLSRAGRVEYQWQKVEPGPIVERIVESMKNTIDARGAVVSVGPLPPAWSDANALEQIFANLIGNALNYLDPKQPGHVEIDALPPADGLIVFRVKDNGVGIPEAYREKIFQAFQRLQPEIAPGEGMGLAIVKRIVERHRGRIWIESAVGRGATFCVALPTWPGDKPLAAQQNWETHTCSANHCLS